jgi:hypothetical protein
MNVTTDSIFVADRRRSMPGSGGGREPLEDAGVGKAATRHLRVLKPSRSISRLKGDQWIGSRSISEILLSKHSNGCTVPILTVLTCRRSQNHGP